MPLPYCPNCRSDIDETNLGWICWQTTKRPAAIAAPTPMGADKYQTGTVAEYRGEKEGVLCEQYNDPGTEQCVACHSPKRRHELACPICRMEVPRVNDMAAHSITITGPSGAGKTHYIVALYEWWRIHLPALGPVVRPVMGRRLTQRFESLRRRVVERNSTLEHNAPGEIISFFWQIRASDDGRPGILFTLPDVAGERTLNRWALAENRHYHFSTGVIAILDGERIAVAHQLAVKGKVRDPNDHLELIEAMLADFDGRLTPQERATLPIAICINKVDVLIRLDPRWDDLMAQHEPRHEGYFDYWRCEERSRAIEALLLSKPRTKAIVDLVRRNFIHVMFFAMAAIGSEAEATEGGTGSIEFAPIAVGDPFLWLLWHLGIVATEPQ